MPEMLFFVVALASNQIGAAARADALARQSRDDFGDVGDRAIGPLTIGQSHVSVRRAPGKAAAAKRVAPGRITDRLLMTFNLPRAQYPDRESAVEGKSVTERGDLGGRTIYHKKKDKT